VTPIRAVGAGLVEEALMVATVGADGQAVPG